MDLHIDEYRAHTEFSPGEFRAGIPAERVLEIRTCQRTLKISLLPLESSGMPRRRFSGAEAYEFLLRFATGLESEIKGETDVFGQVKTAFRDFFEVFPDETGAWTSVFSHLLEDTKEIRAQYLQGLGGNTYGTLARRVLDPTPTSRVLILGAGQIAKSVAPYFADSQLCVYNRTPGRLIELQTAMSKKGYAGIRLLGAETDLGPEIRKADLILLATPAGAELDALVLDHRRPEARVLHLGGTREDLRLPEMHADILTLSELFAIEQEQNTRREARIRQAMQACRQRSVLRSLSRSIHIHHGWEDLAYFT